MAAIDKMYVHSYYEYDDLRRWAIIYYPKLLLYFYNITLSYEDFNKNIEDWINFNKQYIKNEYGKLGEFKTKVEAVNNLRKYYKPIYDCPLRQAKEEVEYLIEAHNRTKDDWEDKYTTAVLNTPLSIDRKLLWICPISCVRKYLEEQCGYKTRWYHRLFWRGKKHFY